MQIRDIHKKRTHLASALQVLIGAMQGIDIVVF